MGKVILIMVLLINGQNIQIPNNVNTVSQLLVHLNINEKIVIVEKNSQVVQKKMHNSEILKDNDKIELVHFVGGGL